MSGTPQVLFIQGAGAGTHAEWDDTLVESLQLMLGDGCEIRYPRMPDEDDPSCAKWSAVIRSEMADLDAGTVVVGHSLRATILINALAEQSPARELGGIVLIAAPFVGEGGWASDDFEVTGDLGARLPHGVRVDVFHGLQDDTVPPPHADLPARAIPQAQLHLLPSRAGRVESESSFPPPHNSCRFSTRSHRLPASRGEPVPTGQIAGVMQGRRG